MTDDTITPAAEPEAPAPVPVAEVPAAAPVDGPGVTLTTGSVPAQVTGPPVPVKATQPVYEAYHQTDRVITDTSDPLAVQVPPSDVEDAFTPIGQASRKPQTPEEAFAS